MSAKEKKRMEEWERSIDFRFGGKKAPEGFDDLEVEEKVTVTLSGRISRINADSEGKSFSLIWDKVELNREKVQPKTMKEAMSATRKKW